MEALVSLSQLALVQGADALIEQDVVDQILMTFLDQWLNLQEALQPKKNKKLIGNANGTPYFLRLRLDSPILEHT